MAGILLFGGTEEGHRLAEELCRRGAQVTVSVATGYGRELLRDVPCTRILAGRLCDEEMITLLGENDFFCVIDATHPYAVEVSQRIQNACRKTETPVCGCSARMWRCPALWRWQRLKRQPGIWKKPKAISC